METQQQQQPRVCPKDCRLCGFQQHSFCAAQMALTSFPMLDKIMAALTDIQTEIKEMKGAPALAYPMSEEPKENNNFGV